jgi:hypothetical protein
MRIGLSALETAYPPYLTTRTQLVGPAAVGGWVESVSERARRELGTWPSSSEVIDALAAALDQAADSAEEPERRSRLKATAQVLTGMARDLAVSVIATKLGGI